MRSVEAPKISHAAPQHRQRGRPKLRSGEAQRLLITLAAWKLFAKGGYINTTVDDIAAHCKISKQTLYRLFPNKQALFVAVIDLHRQSVLALPGDYSRMPLDEALEQIFRIDIDPKEDEQRTSLLRMILADIHQDPTLGKLLWRHGPDQSRRQLAAWLDEQRRRKLIDVDDVDSAAHILMNMILAPLAFDPTDGPHWPKAEERKAHIRRCVAIFLRGVTPGRR